MAEYQDYKSYGAYLGRLFIVFVGIVLIGVLFWYVLGLFTNDNGDTGTEIQDPTTSINGETDTTDTTDQENSQATADDETSSEETAASNGTDEASANDTAVNQPSPSEAAQDQAGQTLATNTDADLPNTGVEHVIGAIAAPFILGAGYTFAKSRRALGKSFNA